MNCPKKCENCNWFMKNDCFWDFISDKNNQKRYKIAEISELLGMTSNSVYLNESSAIRKIIEYFKNQWNLKNTQ